ncbi:MAG: hypothetical protein K6A30_08665 [Lachnospiraceae bacterium]|nr:hypothetical protein [Lachnospiraceae bacterium]
MKKSKLIVTGFMLILILFSFVGCGKKEAKIRGGSGFPVSKTSKAQEKESKELGEVYVFTGFDEEKKMMLFLRVGGSYRQYAYFYNGGTKVIDRFDEAQTLEEMEPGDVYTLNLDENTATVKSMHQSKQAWVYNDVTKYQVDTEKNLISVGSRNFYLGENIPVFDEDEQYMRNQIGEHDVLTLIGYDKDIISVQITTQHGKIAFTNTDKFKDGYFVLGNIAAGKITADKKMKVRAGTFLLKVAADGQGGSKNITIKPGKTKYVDLSKFESATAKQGKLTFDVEQDDVKVYINGKLIDTEKTQTLDYGVYRITAKKDGYDNWSRLLLVNSKKATINIDMKDAEDEEEKSDNNSTTTKENSTNTAGSMTGTMNGTKNRTENNTQNTTDTTKDEKEDEEDSSSKNSTDSSTNSLINEVMNILTGNGD